MADYPAGWVTDIPQGTGEPIAEEDTNAGIILLGLAGAYHSAQTRLSVSTERAAVALWQRLRPLTDADLGRWMDEYDTLLSTAARTQAGLTRAYARSSTGLLSASAPPVPIPVPASQAAFVEQWLSSYEGQVASARLRDSAAALTDTPDWTDEQAALADRLRWLHSPVIKRRWHISEGQTPDEALASVANAVQAEVYAAQRAVEAETVGAIGWPTFKTGAAMMYRRVPQAGACGWCRTVATRLYDLSTFERGRAWHIGCRCTWQLVELSEARRYADHLKKRPGDYYGAAEGNGYWSGTRPDIGARFDAAAAADAGYVSQGMDVNQYQQFLAQRSGTGTTGTTSGTRAVTSSSPAALPGQVTAARLSSVRLQIQQLRERPANAWSQQRLTELADELEALLRELGQ